MPLMRLARTSAAVFVALVSIGCTQGQAPAAPSEPNARIQILEAASNSSPRAQGGYSYTVLMTLCERAGVAATVTSISAKFMHNETVIGAASVREPVFPLSNRLDGNDGQQPRGLVFDDLGPERPLSSTTAITVA